MNENASQKDAKVRAQHTAKPEESTLQRHNSQALGSYPTKQAPQYGRLPAILKLIHDEESKDNVPNNMQVTTVQEQ